MILEAFEAGQAFDVRPQILQGALREVDVVGPGQEVVGTEGGGPGCGTAGREGVGGAGGVVAQGHGAEVPNGDHAGGVKVLQDSLVVFGDNVRVLRGVVVADLYGLRQILDAHEGHVLRRLAREERLLRRRSNVRSG